MSQAIVLLFGFVTILGLANGAILPKDVQFFRITGVDGGVLTAHPGPPPDGHAYPAAGNVTVENFDVSNPAQRWAIYDDFGDTKRIISEVNDWNVVRVYFICPSCFPVDNSWKIEPATGGTSIISTTFILDDKVSCMINNGFDRQISFGPCDGSVSTHWKIVVIPN